MLFSPFLFISFVLLVMSVHYIIPVRLRYLWLLFCSYAFCLTYGVRPLFILLCTTLISFFTGLILERTIDGEKNRLVQRLVLCFGLICCIGPLIFSKIGYSFFAVVGISFYTLQEIGYLFDIYRKKIRAEKHLIYYALYIAFFPKLVSGPIESSDHLLKQINEINETSFQYDRVKSGLLLMLWGFVQKTVISDTFAIYVDKVYGHWEAYSGAMIILATIVFAFQLYADFAGYTNIVLGASQIFGFQLKENFAQPYFAVSIKDFWRRWHISLSTWLREYIYVPLGGNRKGKFFKYLNLMITFLISGLWHGVSFGYLAWGMLHGLYLVLGDFLKSKRNHLLFRRIGVFFLVTFAWIFFRASSFKAALGMIYSCIFRFSWRTLSTDVFSSLGLNVSRMIVGIGCIGFMLFIDYLHERDIHVRDILCKQPIVIRWSFYIVVLFFLTIMQIRQSGIAASNFIYSQF